jgi:chemotaxis protein methyltransferase CheR
MMKFFDESPQGWRAQERLRRMTRFETHNLLNPPPAAASFDIVLCRNVLLYFDDGTRRRAFERLASALAPDGWLLLGAGETTMGQTGLFAPDRSSPGLYRHASCAGALRQAEPRRARI